MYVPTLGPRVPRRDNAFVAAIGRGWMSLAGWKFEGQVPDEPKFVMIVAPHTSNWDFPVGVAALFALGFNISFLGKHTLFKWPLGIFMRWLGGIPVQRAERRDRVAESVAAFKSRAQLILAIAPEGTRKLVKQWKTGFYHVADGAGVPIVLVAFDYGSKTVRIGAPFRTTGNIEVDMPELKKFFVGVVARHPEKFLL